jgi:hypothetical protein
MAWVWSYTRESLKFGAKFDYEASAPMANIEHLSSRRLDETTIPVYKSRSPLRRFMNYHCPPLGGEPVADAVWKKIILKFVPKERIQFYPIRLIAGGEICDNYMWVIPFDRVTCIDLNKSNVVRKIERDDLTMIFLVKDIVHYPNCLGGLHLARDRQKETHLLVSDELKEALSATGETGAFYRPEEVI